MRREMVYPISYIVMIYRFLKFRREKYGNRSVCFSYEGIFTWTRYEEDYRSIARTTIERVIRRLVEDGYLKRVRERPRAVFCITRRFVDALRTLVRVDPEFETLE